jgi:hypothetical protein
MYDFEKYLIIVGSRSRIYFTFSEEFILDNVEYFRDCFDDGISPYKALTLINSF